MFRSIVSAVKAAFKVLVDGIKAALGFSQEAEVVTVESVEVATQKVVAVVAFAAAAGLAILPFPGVHTWSEALYRVGMHLWASNTSTYHHLVVNEAKK